MSSHRRLLALLLIGTTGCATGTSKGPGTSPEKPKSEADLAFTNLSKKAYVALDIKTQDAVVKDVQERLHLTGWIMAKPGHEVVLTAPTAGNVHFRTTKHVPIAGERVSPGQTLLELEPVLTHLEKIQVDTLKRGIESDLVKAQKTLQNAEIEYDRVKQLEKQLGKQAVELAKLAVEKTKEDLASAKEKLSFFQAQNIPLKAPQGGTILQLHVSPGQYVPAAAPLVSIIDLSPMWIRVPVPEFDLPLVDRKASVEVSFKNPNHDRKDQPAFFRAAPTGRVAQVDPVKHTADLWYELEATKEQGQFVKDQMVNVRLPIGRKVAGTIVPYSALVFDTHGHAWVYLERAAKNDKHIFERHPVEMVGGEGESVIVRSNLKGGEQVVTSGAGKLFSRDFYRTPVPEDD